VGIVPEVAQLVVPASKRGIVMSEEVWDKIDDIFQNIAGGKKSVSFEDFAAFYYVRTNSSPQVIINPIPKHMQMDRSKKTVLIIGPGFGRELNPTQSAVVMRSGYNVQWLLDVPNPEAPGFNLQQHLPTVVAALQLHKPQLLMCASKGWHYVVALWAAGYMNYATLMIDAHPTIQQLPKNMNIVVAHGSNDDLYPRDRASLHSLMATADYNRVFLYWACNSGCVNGGYSRYGDKHNMESLLKYDLLPRLMDAALSKCPENEMMFLWRNRLSQPRIAAEELLSGNPEEWVKYWDNKSKEIKILVQPGSEEYKAVYNLCYNAPLEPPNYEQTCPGGAVFSQTRLLKIERVQNSSLIKSAQTYYKKVQDLFHTQDIEFAPNVHSRWLFHGTDALEEIINDPITGFQPLVSGSRLGSLWGAGTYFARDAKYVVESNFCTPNPDGLKRMCMALVITGIPCVGAPEQRGILPYRNGKTPYKYNSTVDTLSSPEIFITQQPSAAYPAYVITYQ